ncbi:helix-turn-helix domain-containing protein [uncultured Chryseobacterium sp.]|uniref:helix-turn-helix domain-containing protein n=1 Tax=uncultured Chryseobacterium sp. TaxID=259322 RepID=UPI0025E049DA|nr:helix-turn-helix domain-containing protein [uncultured Chryseobacterium sp.]
MDALYPSPDYRKIYRDMITIKYPDKEPVCQSILNKKKFTTLDIIRLNNLITGTATKTSLATNQKLRAYDRATIMQILEYQKKNRLNNTQLAQHFKLSRNSVAKWKKKYCSENSGEDSASAHGV